MVAGLAACVVSGLKPHDRLTWFLEVLPVLVGLSLLVSTRRRFPLTPLAYRLLFLHALILILGGHYTYERVPLGLWVKDLLHLQRNNYDRLGHLTQGFVPSIVVREILLRCTPLKRGAWLFVLVTSVCLAFSAAFELFEWGAALSFGQGADAYLATQGDPWDTQWDMFLALVGAILAQTALSGYHDRELEALERSE